MVSATILRHKMVPKRFQKMVRKWSKMVACTVVGAIFLSNFWTIFGAKIETNLVLGCVVCNGNCTWSWISMRHVLTKTWTIFWAIFGPVVLKVQKKWDQKLRKLGRHLAIAVADMCLAESCACLEKYTGVPNRGFFLGYFFFKSIFHDFLNSSSSKVPAAPLPNGRENYKK